MEGIGNWWDYVKYMVQAEQGNMSNEQKNAAGTYQSAAANRDPSMQYGSAPDYGPESGIHGAEIMKGGKDAPVTPGLVIGKSAEVESTMGRSPMAVGGYSVQPVNVDSAQPGYRNSGMQNYLNYMKYRGGY